MTRADRNGGTSDEGRIVHRIQLDDWHATQWDRGVAIFKRGAERPSRILRPPRAWGDRGAWNLTDGGIYFVRTA